MDRRAQEVGAEDRAAAERHQVADQVHKPVVLAELVEAEALMSIKKNEYVCIECLFLFSRGFRFILLNGFDDSDSRALFHQTKS